VLQLCHIHSNNSLVVLLQLAKALEAIRFTLTSFLIRTQPTHSRVGTMTIHTVAIVYVIVLVAIGRSDKL
jgi:hypothetical protein